MVQCSALTKKGTQCQREVSHKPSDNSQYCYQHQSIASSQPQAVIIKKKIPIKPNHYKSIFAKIFGSKLDDKCFDHVKDNLWKGINSYFKSKMSRAQINAIREQVLDKFELYVKTSRQEYLNHMKELETDNPTLVEENVYMDEYIDSVWEVNIEKNGFDDWLMDQIGNWIKDWSLRYSDEEGLREEIRNIYIDSITTVLKTCYH
jgi:hypothetical protein